MSRLSIYLFLPLENVTVDDIKRVSTRMLASKPSVAALGNLANLPKFEEVERAFGNRGNFSGASRFFLFRNWWHQKHPAVQPLFQLTTSWNQAIMCPRVYSCNDVQQFPAAVWWSLVVWTWIKTSAKQNLTFYFLWRVFAKFLLQLVIGLSLNLLQNTWES